MNYFDHNWMEEEEQNRINMLSLTNGKNFNVSNFEEAVDRRKVLRLNNSPVRRFT